MTEQTYRPAGPGAAGAAQPLRAPGTVSFPSIGPGEDKVGLAALPDHLSTDSLTNVELKACVALMRLLAVTGADWTTEKQWRSFADRDHEDHRVRGFRLPELLEKGVVEMTTAVFHAAVYGAEAQPLPIYRLKQD
ncbi:hypothetical protein KIKIMORA_04470 [Brevundimonas phage vB_BpoS-Kikimora]|uniref:Uncharacterized protein n=1 Tax=Brevundimonas phage vB_BpoS-Kikimora TaxID=2948601 RepID=A0A9E7SL31_9CAUD|nr:hypothetical protein KIKIMORA_04470 [Brevundimonas phage vB_BpoS-Kikimora]